MAETLEHIDPDNTVTTFRVRANGPVGRLMPPIESVSDRIPGRPGAVLRAVQHGIRPIKFTALTWADDDRVAFRGGLRALAHALDPTRGDSRLRATGPDGVPRQITCRYAGDLDRIAERFSLHQELPLVFNALDPYWYDTADIAHLFTQGTSTAKWFPFFPITMSSSEVFGELSVDNTGDVVAWPVITVGGPGSSIVIENVTTGKRADLNRVGSAVVLVAGESVTIDTRPGLKAVTRNNGANLFSSLTDLSAFWGLIPGAQTIRVAMGGATAGSYVQIAYRRRFLSA